MTALPTLALRLGEDSISRFEAAASRRLAEASILLERGQLLPSIYLLGYVAEMRMKAARFRVRGLHIHDEISPLVRKQAVDEAKSDGLPLTNFPHDLEDEATLLLYTKKKWSAGYPRQLSDQITFQATALNARWRPGLRYRAIVPLQNEAQIVRDAAQWFEDNYARLWS